MRGGLLDGALGLSYTSAMNEGPPKTASHTSESVETRKEYLVALAKELHESHEIFPFPGLEPGSYTSLKASDEEFPGYSTPIDDLIERFEKEGMKVVLGEHPESGNVFILPAQSDDIENDMVFPKHFQTGGVVSEKLRRLIEQSK
jgi:hypothetical protein